MFGIQDLLDEMFSKQFEIGILCTQILESELKKISIQLTDEQRFDLEKKFRNYNKKSIAFNFSDQQINDSIFSSEEGLKDKLEILFSEFDELMEHSLEKVEDKKREIILHIIDDVTDRFLSSNTNALRDNIKNTSIHQQKNRDQFNKDIQSHWGHALDLLEVLIVMSDEVAQSYLARTDKYSSNDIVQNLLSSIHAKSSQVSKEILIMLRHGFADGAHARWRSLYELSVMGSFISHSEEDVALKYIQHQSIQIYRAAKEYNEHCSEFEISLIPHEEMIEIEQEYDALINKYGESYKHYYGWASDALKLKKPTFRDIETSVGLSHTRPYYKAASARVHASSEGVLSSLGLLPGQGILLAGSSNIGLSYPARLTAISLTQVTTSVLAHKTNIDFLIACKIMARHSEDVESEFIRAESEFQSDGD
jgi:hypothetical protein